MLDYLKTLKFQFQDEYKKQKFPYISTTFLLSGAGIYYLGKENESKIKANTTEDYFKNSFNKVMKYLSIKREVPILPKQEISKPTFVFDLEDFLIARKFSLFKLGFETRKRAYTDVFLFHMAHIYELILLSESKYDEKLVEKIDPYGCISYRVASSNISNFKKDNLNRDLKKTVFIKSNKNKELSQDFTDNCIILPKWQGEQDNKLMDLLNFCSNLALMDIKDYRNTIKTYKDTDFFKAYDFVQKNIFKAKNLFSFNYDKSYQKKIKKVIDERVKEFKNAKIEMDQHILRDKMANRGIDIWNRIFNFVVSSLA